MYRVLVVEDQQMNRQLFELFIAQSENFTLIKSVVNANLAFEICEHEMVDLILMDIYTEGGASGLVASEEIKKKFPWIKIIIVTSLPEYSYLERARAIGVDSFWYKEVSKEPIVALMERTMAGEHIFPDTTPEIAFGNAKSLDLSEREIEVLREMTTGKTNTEIASELFMSTSTVKTHIQHMLEKTGFKNRTELAVKARELGLVIKDKEE